MDRHASRINHVGLTLLGLVLTAAGAMALARGLGAFGQGPASDALITGQMRRYAAEQGWFWPVVAASGVVLTLLGLAWLLAQARSERLPGLALGSETSDGTTRLTGKAVTQALEEEVGEYPGVQGVQARLLGSSRKPRLRLNVAYRRNTDLADLRDHIEHEAVAHLRTALERDSLPAMVKLRPVSGEQKRTVA
ncbi:alkaline shock response membrane anchor protein AmaP [Actinomadura sp. 9N407]|uniref:alkaline shock response membrane anchor protein AmaP n=1 Tax=Actinomadura sp. 9N407 TaxID=3375154 RepID=UPI0037B06E12